MAREVFGWICLGIMAICAIGVFIISSKAHNPHELKDPRTVFEIDYEHFQKLSKNPLFQWFLIVGLSSGIAGFILIMME